MTLKSAHLSVLYFMSSSALLVLNKVAITAISNASALLLVQITSTILLVGIFGRSTINFSPSAEVIRAYTTVAAVFLATIYSNFRLIHIVGVNSFIVLRSTTPLLVSTLDWGFLGRELPQGRSLLALIGIFISGGAYAWPKLSSSATESTHVVTGLEGLFWCCVWLGSFTLDMVYIKYVVDSHRCNGLERTLYQNTLSLPFLAVIICSSIEEHSMIESLGRGSLEANIALFLSCIAGTVLSFTGMTLRSELSATSFTVLGIVCKMASSLLNELFAVPENSFTSMSCIFSAILCSSVYRQAPLRTASEKPSITSSEP